MGTVDQQWVLWTSSGYFGLAVGTLDQQLLLWISSGYCGLAVSTVDQQWVLLISGVGIRLCNQNKKESERKSIPSRGQIQNVNLVLKKILKNLIKEKCLQMEKGSMVMVTDIQIEQGKSVF